MEDSKPFLSDKFCNEMINEGKRYYEHLFAPIRSKLELCEKNSKLVIIQFHLIEVRENLKANKFKISCSLNDIENDLKGWLERYFKTTRFSEVTSVEYVNSLRPKQYEIPDETTTLKVKNVDINLDGKLNFEFWRFNNFDQLQYYIGWSLLLLELNRLEKECKEDHTYINEEEFAKVNQESKNDNLSDFQSIKQEDNIEEFNPYPHIFTNPKAFKLFEFLLEKYGEKYVTHSDCSFIFRQMQSDGYIYNTVSESKFRDFLNESYEIDMEKLKTLNNCKLPAKQNFYSLAIIQIYTN